MNEAVPPSAIRTKRWRLVATVASLAFLVALSFLVDGAVYGWLHENFNYYMRPVPDSLKLAHRILRSMEDWGENVFIVAIAVAMWQMDRQRRSRVVLLVGVAVVVTLPVELVKRLTGRERPSVSQGTHVWHGPRLWNEGGDYQSFPSGHTAAACAYSGTLASFYPPLRPVVVSLALGCAANRVWKERHFLSDCLVAAILGFGAGWAIPRVRLVRRFTDRLDDWLQPRIRLPKPPLSANRPDPLRRAG